MPMSTISSTSSSSRSSDGLPFQRAMSEFEVDQRRNISHSSPQKTRRRTGPVDYNTENAYRANVAKLNASKSRPFTVAGRIPFDPATLVLFFRSKSGITHSLDFPIDVDYDLPPSLEVLIEACRPQSVSGLEEFSTHESVFYPHNLPVTTSLELANHPILDAIRNTLFPTLPPGRYLTAIRDKLEIWVKGRGMKPPPRSNDGRVATVSVTLPVRYRGGALVVRNKAGIEERFSGRGGKAADMEWVAYTADCEHEIEPIGKGCRMSISYALFVRDFGPSGSMPDPLITPSDHFLNLVSPILAISRGRRIGFYLTGEYGVNPGEVLAESLVPNLKGGDALLYHALKVFKLTPELRWTSGGYMWPVDQVIDLRNGDDPALRSPFSVLNGKGSVGSAGSVGSLGSPPRRAALATVSESGDSPQVDLRTLVVKGGGVPVCDTDIYVLPDQGSTGPITREKVPYANQCDLKVMVVSVLLVAFVP